AAGPPAGSLGSPPPGPTSCWLLGPRPTKPRAAITSRHFSFSEYRSANNNAPSAKTIPYSAAKAYGQIRLPAGLKTHTSITAITASADSDGVINLRAIR